MHTHIPPPTGTRALSQSLRPNGSGSRTPFPASSFQRHLTTTTPNRSGEDGKPEGEDSNDIPPSEVSKPIRTLRQKKKEQKAAAKAAGEQDAPDSTVEGHASAQEAHVGTEESHAPFKPATADGTKRTRYDPRDSSTKPAVVALPRQKRVLKLKQHEPAKHPTPSEPPPKKEDWQAQKAALKEKFPDGWNPRKKLSPDALAGIRALHQQFPEEYTTEVLAEKFEVSAEAVRRILKSKWEPNPEEEIDRQERWFNRGKQIWATWAELGKKPPERWRKEGITRSPEFHEQRKARAKARSRLARTLM